MAAILKVWRQIENTMCQSMRIYLRNIPAKFNPDPIWNGGGLGVLRRSSKQEQEEEQQYEYIE